MQRLAHFASNAPTAPAGVLRPRFTRALVLVNPHAGATRPAVVEQLSRLCREALGSSAAVRSTSAPGHAVELIGETLRDSEPGERLLVIAAGGDGTVREAAEGLARQSGRDTAGERAPAAALAVAPLGSGNSAYRALWGERPWQAVLGAALGEEGCPVIDIDLVRFAHAGRASLLGVNFGLIAAIAQALERRKALERRDGRPPHVDPREDPQARYWEAFAEVLERLEPFPARVEVDGHKLYEGLATLVAVGGVSHLGRGEFRLLPRARLDDGRLDVCVLAAVGAERLGELAAMLPDGSHLAEPEVRYAQCSRARVERRDGRPLAIEHDGDPRAGLARVALEVAPAAVPVVCAALPHSLHQDHD